MALQVSVNLLLLLLVVSPRTSAFNVDTADPIFIYFGRDNLTVDHVMLQNRNSTPRLFVETSSSDIIEFTNIKCYTFTNSYCSEATTGLPVKPGTTSAVLWMNFGGFNSLFALNLQVTVNKHQQAKKVCLERMGSDEDSSQLRLITADFNNDGLTDYVMGESTFSEYIFEDGRVTVFIKRKQGTFDTHLLNSSGFFDARFGTSISCIGDINLDGFQDLAVGAPGEDGGRGAIYIYHGSAAGIKHDYSQRIAAEDVSRRNTNLRGFGAAISKAVDIDGNNYGDLAVVAALSSQVVLLRSRPAVRLQTDFDTIDVSTYDDDTILQFQYCRNYTGKYVPNEIDVLFKVESFIYHTQRKTYSPSPTNVFINYTFPLHIDSDVCDYMRVSLKDLPTDKNGVLLPALLRLETNLHQSDDRASTCNPCPLLDIEGSRMSVATVHIHCKDHGHCKAHIQEGWPIVGMVEKSITEEEGLVYESDLPLILSVVGSLLVATVVVTALYFLYRRKNKKPTRPNVLMPPYHPQLTEVPSQASEAYYEVPGLVQPYDDVGQR